MIQNLNETGKIQHRIRIILARRQQLQNTTKNSCTQQKAQTY